MAREGEEITFKCELHASVNAAEVTMNQIIRYLWGGAWPPTPHRTGILGGRIAEISKETFFRVVDFTFDRLPYETVRLFMRKYPDREWQAQWAVVRPNPEWLLPEPQLEKGPVYLHIYDDGRLQIADSRIIPNLEAILEGND